MWQYFLHMHSPERLSRCLQFMFSIHLLLCARQVFLKMSTHTKHRYLCNHIQPSSISRENRSITQVGIEAGRTRQDMEMDFSFWKALLFIYQGTTCTKDSPLHQVVRLPSQSHRVPPKKKQCGHLRWLQTQLWATYKQLALKEEASLNRLSIHYFMWHALVVQIQTGIWTNLTFAEKTHTNASRKEQTLTVSWLTSGLVFCLQLLDFSLTPSSKGHCKKLIEIQATSLYSYLVWILQNQTRCNFTYWIWRLEDSIQKSYITKAQYFKPANFHTPWPPNEFRSRGLTYKPEISCHEKWNHISL